MANPLTFLYVDWLISRSRYLMRRKQADAALPLCERSVAVAPTHAQAWFHLGYVYLQLNRPADALDASNRALSLQPQNKWAWQNTGVALLRLHRYQESLAAFTQLNGLAPDYMAGWAATISALFALGRYAEAQVICAKVLALEPQNTTFLTANALALTHQQHYEGALAIWKHLQAQGSKKGDYLISQGWTTHRSGQLGEAARLYAQGFNQSQGAEKLTAENNIGAIYFDTQYYERALAIHDSILARDAEHVAVLVSSGQDLIWLGRYDEAYQRLTNARALPHTILPSAATIPALFGLFYIRVGQTSQAQVALREAHALDPNNENVQFGYAELLLNEGETETAMMAIQRALQLAPHDASAWSLKSRILQTAGDEAGANEAERHGSELLAQQRAELAEFEREFPEWANSQPV